jgi:hypothetical protein
MLKSHFFYHINVRHNQLLDWSLLKEKCIKRLVETVTSILWDKNVTM